MVVTLSVVNIEAGAVWIEMNSCRNSVVNESYQINSTTERMLHETQNSVTPSLNLKPWSLHPRPQVKVKVWVYMKSFPSKTFVSESVLILNDHMV